MFKSLFANASIEIEWINNKSEMKKNKQNISEKGGKTETICLQKLTHRKIVFSWSMLFNLTVFFF